SGRDFDDVLFLPAHHPRRLRRLRRQPLHRFLSPPDSRREQNAMTAATDRATEPACLELALADYPGMNPFVLDWMSGEVDAFLPRNVGQPLRLPGPAGEPALREALIESNKRWGLFVRDEVERWASGESVAIIAG